MPPLPAHPPPPAPAPPAVIGDAGAAGAPADARVPVRAERPRIGRALAAASIVAVLVLTLLPQPGGPTFAPWCLVCGDVGGADVVANVALFLPLGVGLALAGVPWRRAVAVGCLLALGVEVAQLAGVPGRTGTLSDLLTNTLGTLVGHALGASWPHWLRPRPRLATALAALAAAVWLGVQGFGAWMYAVPRTPPSGPPRPLAETLGRPYGWYAGHVSDASVDGIAIPHAGTGPVRVTGALGTSARVDATVDASDPRPGLVPLVLVADSTGRERLLLGQLRGDVVAIVGERPLHFRLRRPFARVVSGLYGPGVTFGRPAALLTPRRVSGGIRGDTLWVRATGTDGRWHHREVRLAPALLWSAVAPFVIPGTPAGDALQAAWLAALLAPLGYWLAWASRRPSAAARWAVATAGAALVGAAGTWGLGRVAGFTASPLGDWAAATAGAACAAALGALLARRAAPLSARRPFQRS